MKIFVNEDSFNPTAVQTKKKLIEICLNYNIEIAEEIEDADIIFSVGGDGTFLKTSCQCDKPIIGINTGTLGYLTEIEPKNIEKSIKNILDGNFYIEKRMMLEGEIIKSSGDVIKIPPALNEIAISKNAFGVVRFDVLVNEKLINSYTADGILLCTPTGSTAYNLSCGGPIVDPTANILTLTPIAPHSVINRSIVLSDDSDVEIRISKLRENTACFVLYDGKGIDVQSNDTVKIKKSDKITKIIKLEERSFVDMIRDTIA